MKTMKTGIVLTICLSVRLAAAGSLAEISSPAGAGAAQPFLSAAKGGILMSWMEPEAGGDLVALRFARFHGGAWSAPRTIAARNDFFVNWADFPSIVEDAHGVLFAHWLQKSAKDSYAYDIYLSTSANRGASWDKPFLLNRDGKRNEHGFVSLAPLPAGGVGATWLDGRNMPEGKETGEMTLRYARIDASGNLRDEVQLDDRTCECCTTGMAMADGKPVIAYRDRSATEVRDIAVVRRRGDGWSTPHLIHQDGWKIAGCPVNGPQVAASGPHVAVAWFTAGGERPHVSVAFSQDGGGTFGEAVIVDGGKPVGRVDVVMLDAERAVVSWSEQTAAGAELLARMVGRNRKAGPIIKVADSSTARASGFARMAASGGDVYIAWTEQTGGAKSVHVVVGHW